MLLCPVCKSEIPDTEPRCLTCWFDAGAPNVRAAARSEEANALEGRYQRALERARRIGCQSKLLDFSEAVKKSSAVINVDVNFLHFFVTNRKSLYANYERAVAGHGRKPAAFQDDAARRGVGSILFGSYAIDIIYAALSLNGYGPSSYGGYAIKLKDLTICNRATVLESNSFDFVRTKRLAPGKRLPLGYLAPWDSRHKIAVAKLGKYITSQTTDNDFCSLLLSSAGNRVTDDFLEVHIYGSFDLLAVESVTGGSMSVSKNERNLLSPIKQHLKKAGIAWIEK